MSKRRNGAVARSRSEEKFDLICQAAFDAILVHDSGTIIEASEKCAALFGYAAGDMIGRSITQLIAPEAHEELLLRVRDRSSAVHLSVGLRADGSRFALESCGVTMNDSTMRVVALRDVTQRDEAEAELRATADRYRDLIENSHDLICTHDLGGRILSANPAMGRAAGVDARTLIGRHVQDLLFPRGVAEFDEYIGSIVRDGVASGTMIVRAANGSRRTWEYRNTLRTDGVDIPIVRGIARDITDCEEANRALRFSEDHFRSIIENVSDFISIIETSGVIGYSSPSVETLLGWKASEIVGTLFVELVHPDELEQATKFFAAGAVKNAPAGRIALRLRDCIGAWRSFEVVTKSVVQSGRASIVATARDITDRVLLEKQLEQANRLTSLGRLAATVAHEFNNVLMGMLPFAELLQRSSISKQATEKAAWHIAGSVSRGKRIVQDILRFTRPADPDVQAVDLASWWEMFGREMSAQTANHVRLVADLGKACVLADAGQLSQIVANLIANARDAMPRGGTITVRVRPASIDGCFAFGVVPHAERYTHISVEDEGDGIAPDDLNHIFDPLFTTKQNGTGLGLAIAHQVITRHAGYILVESEVGRGTTFHIFLPSAAPSSVDAPQHGAQVRRGVAARRVMIVEDEEIIVDGIVSLLALNGIEADSVACGEDAVAGIDRFDPDFVVMDIGLPGIDGVEAYRRIRGHGFSRPVIFSTGHGDRTHLADLPPDRLTRFLQKPFEIDDLLRTIADLESDAAATL